MNIFIFDPKPKKIKESDYVENFPQIFTSIKNIFYNTIYYLGIISILGSTLISVSLIPSSSMAPTIRTGDLVITSNIKFRAIQNNDIIGFKANNILYAKRLIAGPGDKIKYENGILYINDKPKLLDFYQYENNYYQFLSDNHYVQYINLLPDDSYFPEIIIPKDSYFVMGDNRDNSRDSRTELGFIKKNQIILRLHLVLFNIFDLFSTQSILKWLY